MSLFAKKTLPSFEEQLKNVFLPAVERMIKKEKKHLEFLKKQRDIFKNRNFDLTEIDKYIENSQFLLNHFKYRHEEYYKLSLKK